MTLDDETVSSLSYGCGIAFGEPMIVFNATDEDGTADMRAWRASHPREYAAAKKCDVARALVARRHRATRVIAVIAPYVGVALIARAILVRLYNAARQRDRRASTPLEVLRAQNRKHQKAKRDRERAARAAARAA